MARALPEERHLRREHRIPAWLGALQRTRSRRRKPDRLAQGAQAPPKPTVSMATGIIRPRAAHCRQRSGIAGQPKSGSVRRCWWLERDRFGRNGSSGACRSLLKTLTEVDLPARARRQRWPPSVSITASNASASTGAFADCWYRHTKRPGGAPHRRRRAGASHTLRGGDPRGRTRDP